MNQTEQIYQQGLAFHHAGRFAEAEQCYQRVLALNPRHADTLHLFGVLAAQVGRPEIAVQLISQAIEIAPKQDSYYGNLALAYQNLEQFEQAQAAYAKALKLNPRQPEALNNLGILQRQTGQLTESEQTYRKLLRLVPNHPEGLNNFGLTLADLDKNAEAKTCYQRAIALRPNYPEAHYNLANLLREQGEKEKAADQYRQALIHRPAYPQAQNNLGLTLLELQRFQEAAQHLTRALELRPDSPATRSNLGLALKELGRLDEAEAMHRQALAEDPNSFEAWNNLGNVLKEQKRLDEAEQALLRSIALNDGYAEALCNLGTIKHEKQQTEEALALYAKALALNPNYASGYFNRAIIAHQAERLEEAIDGYRKAIALDPKLADARTNLSMALLSLGQWQEGWDEYEWRWRTSDGIKQSQKFPSPAWAGEEISGKSLLLYSEQGFGDSLQFCRYASLAAQRGAKVTLAIEPALERLMKSLAGIEAVVVKTKGELPPACDHHSPLLSLPRLIGPDPHELTVKPPYLSPDPADVALWGQRLAEAAPDDGKLKVGLVWAGHSRPDLPNAAAVDRRRSMKPDLMEPLLAVQGCRFISLQKDGVKAPDSFGLIDLMEHSRDFADTAALVSHLDLVISVDTAMAHLVGAIGKPLWLLDRFDACWRWQRGREDSAWYPGMRLFRQTSPGDWPGVIARTAEALKALVGN